MSANAVNYTPPPTVREFIKHYRPGELFADWILGPVGSGKTTGIFFKLVYMAARQAPSPRDGIRRSRAVIVRNTAPQLNDTTIKSFSYWFKDGVAGKWKATTRDFILRFGDVECEVMFRPLDTPDDVQRVLSLEVTFAILDEFVQIPQAIVEALEGRCGRYPPAIDGGATNWGMWGASNPGMETDWWYPMLIDPEQLPEDQVEPEHWQLYEQPSGFSPDAENLENLPGKADYYLNLAKGKTTAWIKRFIEVSWGYSLTGKPVFPMFNKDIHVAKAPIPYDRTLPLYAGYDPGMRCGFVIGQYDADAGQLRILRALALENYATDRLIAEKVKPMLFQHFRGAELEVIPDPSSVNSSQAKQGSSVIAELRKHFKVHYDGNNQIESRLQPAQYYMMRLTSRGAALLIDPSCTDLIRALSSGYRWTVSKDDAQKEVPDKNKASNIADGFTYLCRFVRQGEERAGRRKVAPQPRRRSVGNAYALSGAR